MYSKWRFAINYLRYYLTASNGKGHGMHSPFVFEFITKVLRDQTHYPEYDIVEAMRSKLLKDHTNIHVRDYGAGKDGSRTIASITKNAAKPSRFGQLLFRMVRKYQPESIIELGTSLGITTSYLSKAAPGATICTMEGASEVAATASGNFNSIGVKNIRLVEGNFDNTLLPVLSSLNNIDFAFVDGNHTQEPTERYFSQLLPKMGNDSILIFDDIHWSPEMEAAWKNITSHPAVRCSIDLFFIGIIFFRREFREKQHFTIRF